MSKDIIKLEKGRYLILLKSDFKKHSRRAKKMLLKEMKKWNELFAEELIKYGE